MGVYKKGENWFIDFWYRGKRYRRKVSPDKRQAELALKKIKVAIAENKFFDVVKQHKILFSQMATEYVERYSKLNKRSFKKDENILRQLVQFFGRKYLYEITPIMIEDYKAKRIKEGRKPATINRELACMKHMYTKAIEWGKATENPVKKVKLLKVNNQRTRFLEKGEIKMLLEECPSFLKPIVIVALNTGMRLSEIMNMTWDDIDFIRGFITIKNTKNNETRYIPINSTLMVTFEKLKENCNPDSPYVFCDKNGDKLNGDSVSHIFNRTLKKCGIKNFRFHDLRHTFASYLVMTGEDIMTVKELLGHKTLAMTLRYSHLSPDFKRSAVERLSQKFSFQTDTFWTPEVEKEKLENLANEKNIRLINTFLHNSKREELTCLDIQNGQE